MSTKTMNKTHQTGRKKWLSKESLIEQKSLIALLFLIVVVSFLNPHFFSVDNLLNILRQTSVNAIIAVGMTLVILTAGIDLSVGSVLALCGALAASLIAMEVPVMIALPMSLIAGAGLGALSGFIIAKGKVQAFIATLVTMTLLRGVTMVYTDGRPISTGFTDTADAFAWFGTGYVLGIPVPVWLMVLVFAAVWYLLTHTRFGRYVYALGGNESATRLSGINVDRVKIGVYAICGLLAALAGIIITSRLSSAQPTAGMGYELDAIAAVVLGGTSLMGGKGRIMGTLIGALIIGFLNNALNLLDVTSYYQMIAKALVILLAVLVDNKNK
ncbi:ribose ABC transporter permease [Vibrio ostreicida]|uniref:ribose ABC transporter permease n=1 Tax=Vibrio ostreicida TaxID=526588 RepID=UPI000970B61E|nr:ribose ABC transporter permease [Vibrio ostreicida]